MKVALFFVCLTASGCFATDVTPVAKVLEMLNSVLAKSESDRIEEQKIYTAYAQWCEYVTAKKTRELNAANQRIEEITAEIAKLEAHIQKLTNEIEALDANIANWQLDLASAKKLRASEHADYETAHKDYSESIDALQRAIAVLKKQDYSRVQAALVQVANMHLVDGPTRKAITSFLSQDPNTSDLLNYNAPEANAYEFQSGGVIDMLEKLHIKFEDELSGLEKEETNAKHAFEMLAQDLNDQIDTATNDRNRRATAKARAETELAEAKADLAATIELRDACQKFLDDIAGPCRTKGEEFQARQQLRDEEIAAVKQAIEIIDTRVAGNAAKHITHHALLQVGGHSSLLQLRSEKTNPAQKQMVAFLKARGAKIHSRMLMQLAAQAQEDPFKKVKQMISDLIVRLLEQANEEAEHHGWCMTELASNEQTRKQKTAEIDVLTSQIDKLEADIGELAKELADLADQIAALHAAMAEASRVRTEEHAKNMATIKDGQESGQATEEAIRILREFYAQAADATALLQQPSSAATSGYTDDEIAPDTWDTVYTGQAEFRKGGIIAMLEVILSDFARLVTETQADEDAAAQAYEKFMHESALDMTAMNKDVAYKEYEKENKEAALESAKTDLRNTQEELDAALAYYEKLKPSCVEAGVSYEDRVARRKEEVESLQEALRILNGESFEGGELHPTLS